MDQHEKVIILGGVNAFNGLSDEQLALLADEFSERSASAGDAVMHEGQKVQALFVIVDGRVAVELGDSEVDVAELSEGEIFGEYSFVDLRPASATIEAMEDSRFLVIDHHRLHELLDDHCMIARQVYYNLLLVLINRLREDDAELDSFTLSLT